MSPGYTFDKTNKAAHGSNIKTERILYIFAKPDGITYKMYWWLLGNGWRNNWKDFRVPIRNRTYDLKNAGRMLLPLSDKNVWSGLGRLKRFLLTRLYHFKCIQRHSIQPRLLEMLVGSFNKIRYGYSFILYSHYTENLNNL